MKNGFTLIELLITMVVIGILTLIAIPSYTDYVVRARRSDAQTSLLNLASKMERYYSDHNTYQTATIGAGGDTDVLSTAVTPEGWYSLSITSATNAGYTIQATPLSTQASKDTLCQTLTLNSLGVKGIVTGPGGTPKGPVSKCW